ncbi:MAG: hypothetical protein LAT67_05060 [Balneolales bacterium]|nr:hypothetical protein [Balneolales bacterium]
MNCSRSDSGFLSDSSYGECINGWNSALGMPCWDPDKPIVVPGMTPFDSDFSNLEITPETILNAMKCWGNDDCNNYVQEQNRQRERANHLNIYDVPNSESSPGFMLGGLNLPRWAMAAAAVTALAGGLYWYNS